MSSNSLKRANHFGEGATFFDRSQRTGCKGVVCFILAQDVSFIVTAWTSWLMRKAEISLLTLILLMWRIE
jgi:hypothetical protein